MLAQTFSLDQTTFRGGKTRQDNNFVYNLYILCSVDDIGILHHNALSIFNTTNDYLSPKFSLVGDPDMTPGFTLRLTRRDKLYPYLTKISYWKFLALACAYCSPRIIAPTLTCLTPLTLAHAPLFWHFIGLMGQMVDPKHMPSAGRFYATIIP